MSVIEELYAKFLEPECLSEIVSFDTRTSRKVTWHLHWNLPEPDLGVAPEPFIRFPLRIALSVYTALSNIPAEFLPSA